MLKSLCDDAERDMRGRIDKLATRRRVLAWLGLGGASLALPACASKPEPVFLTPDALKAAACYAGERRTKSLLIRQHGSHFATRQLTSHAGVRLDGRFLTIATDDRRFGTVTLDLGDQAQVWAASLRRLGATA